ncbi:winged helix-turn-helix domain-containing protein [Actinospica sp. MGRD01-02]|uniref:Winged helix-turn-helix domain-containing protein n=1 Tax=Actinospica acidithermotolerans TaxID=2828514 RepID=A0A941E834_9ACTN|nr:helix-turn-helix domain-containing protein [Actinospica acidithermotolerans]MBR7826756.1 winged helix-turn-helix domain-containing protein [Actinospica acidithermotolerans]
MSDGWMAEAGPDPTATARAIAGVKEAFLAGEEVGGVGPRVRPVVAQSWQRCVGLDPAEHAPVTLTGTDLESYRAAHPLAQVMELLRELVGGVAEDGKHLMAVCDATGRLLWVEGHRWARGRAERMNFVEGAVWDEASAGTNAPGTALALDHAVQIFASEHFRPAVQSWTCAAAPIHDPATGRILGIVDVTGGDIVAHPHSLALVNAAAKAAEAQLAASPGWRRESDGALWVPGAGEPASQPYAAARLLALGRDQAVLVQRGRETRFNRRHSEILAILARHPEGLTGDQLATALYDDDSASEATVRVEVTRLRRVLGDLIGSRPYRLTAPVTADFLDVARALREKNAQAALDAYAGPLLPRSEAPSVLDERNRIDARLRTAVLESGDPKLIDVWLERCGPDDLDAWERLVPLLPPGARRAEAAGHVRRLAGDRVPRPVRHRMQR